mmetsp:Transcript_42410/g.43183  ORF Transcript_42410/g.43183 Transcript_42410/m.43183 type:complete len:168 (-) Transcript_42410:303-806(-)
MNTNSTFNRSYQTTLVVLFTIGIIGTLSVAARNLNHLRSDTKNDNKINNNNNSDDFVVVGTWRSTNLLPGMDPGLPDEDIIVIDEKTIKFPNGGGGFGNGPYTISNEEEKEKKKKKIYKQQGDETITYELVGENNINLKVTFAGGDYGNPDPVIYVRSSDDGSELIE